MTKKQAIIILLILGLSLYFNSVFNGFVWDDEEQIVNNAFIHSIKNWPKFFLGGAFYSGGTERLLGIYYKPVMTLTFSLLYSIFGPRPAFFHLFQILLHATNSILVFILFQKIFKKTVTSFLVSTIFLTHPLYSEVVLYASNMQDVLYFLFGMLGLLLIVRKNSRKSYLFLISTFFLLSLLSKETGAIFIGLSLLWTLLLNKARFFSVLFASFSSVFIYLILRFQIAQIPLTKNEMAPIARLTLFERLINIPKVSFYYLKNLFIPYDLSINQHWIVKDVNFQDFYFPLLISILLGLVLSLYFLLLIKRKGTDFKVFVFFFFWLISSFFIHLQIFPLDVTVTGRWFYTPMVGFLGILAIPLSKSDLPKNKLLMIALILIILVFSAKTFIRTFDWRNGLTLYGKDIQNSKDNFNLENNYGVELFRAGRIEEAKSHFENSVRLAPHWWTNWNNLGVIQEREGNVREAEISYRKAIENGGYYLAFENLANLLLFKKKDAQPAKEFTEESLKLLPYNPKLWLILALSEYKLGNRDRALKAAENAYRLSQTDETFYVYSQLLKNEPLELNF